MGIALLSLLLQGCTQEETIKIDSASPHYINVAMETGMEENGEMLTIESLRLLVFNSTGSCTGNRKYAGSDCLYGPEEQAEGRGYRKISLSVPMPIEDGGKEDTYDVYAVLNEEGFSSMVDESTSLGDRLADSRLDKTAFLQLLEHTALRYDTSTAQKEEETAEPAFVMCAYKTNVSIPEYATLDNPYIVILDESKRDNRATDRTMAMITLNHILGEEADQDASSVSRVFVLDVSIANVPKGYAWSNDKENTGTGMTSLPVPGNRSGSYDEETTYYTREWGGIITQTITGHYTQHGVAADNVRLYRMKNNNGGQDVWLVKTDVTSTPMPYKYSEWNHARKYDANNGAYLTYLKNLFATGGILSEEDENITWWDEAIELVPQESQIEGDDWSIDIGKSWYVPENRVESEENATCLKIRLALADPLLNDIDYTKDIVWDTDSVEIFVKREDASETLNQGIDVFLRKYAKACHADNTAIVEPEGYTGGIATNGFSDKNAGKYYFFVGDFSATRSGTLTKKYTTDQNNTDQNVTVTRESWDIKKETITEFIIPVNNNIDNRNKQGKDYSVYRNTKYGLTVKVNDTAYEILQNKRNGLSTKSRVTGLPPVTLQIETTELSPENR